MTIRSNILWPPGLFLIAPIAVNDDVQNVELEAGTTIDL